MKRGRYVLRNKLRFFIFAVILLSLGTALFFSSAAQGGKQEDRITVTVRKGDTLWEIAEHYRGRTEIRKFIYKIKKANNIEDSRIYSGMEIVIP